VSSSELRVLTEPLGGSALSRLAQAGEGPIHWYPARPASPGEWRSYVEALRHSAPGWPDLLLRAASPGGSALRRLENAAREGGIVVTTGQQPGLFGGPIYTWAKAVSALACANVLEEVTGVPVLPVFWAATDDSDFLEASWTVVASGGLTRKLTLADKPADGTRLADVLLGDVGGLLGELSQACGSAADRRVLELVTQSFVAGTSFGSAYVRLLRGLLEPMGIAVLDAAHPEVSRAADPLLRRALEQHAPLASALVERDSEIRAAGYRPQVLFDPGRTLVFGVAAGRRQRIAATAAEEAMRLFPIGALSPNVLLRPVVERSLLPTAAYMAGPGELAYFAQASAVANALAAPLPLALPRWSTTLLEPEVARVLEKYHLEIGDLANRHEVEKRLARASWPDPVSQALRRLRHSLDVEVGLLAAEIRASGPLLGPAAVASLAQWIHWRVDRFERRLNAAVKKREEEMMHDIALASASLFPDGVRQERVLNILPLLCRFGLEVLDRMRNEAEYHARAILLPGAAALA
jgi:uncharacterized protein YllA (UPF0747 family)